MARILFTWELGRGLGHLVRYKALIASLIQDGHEIHYIARNAEKVRFVNAQAEIKVQEISPEFTPRPQQITDPRLASYSTLLFNCGFSDVHALSSRLQHWVTVIKQIRPDCIIADHSPTALLANRILGIPLVVAGNGFTLPPAKRPMALFQPELGDTAERRVLFENKLSDILNASLHELHRQAPGIAGPADLLRSDQSWLMTFKELDCYGAREGGKYLGTYPNDEFGEKFNWPVASGPKVFAYLQSDKGLEALGQWTADRGASVCLVMPRLVEKHRHIIARNFSKKSTYLSDKPIKINDVVDEVAVGITNGNANILANLALAGIPQFALPISMETFMEARQSVHASCGLMATGPDFSSLRTQLDELVDNPVFRARANQLAQTYADSTSELQTELLRKSLYELIF